MKQKTRKTENYRSIKVLGVKVDLVSLEEILFRVENWVKSNKQYQITTPNPEHIILAQGDYRFMEVINKSALAVPDGIGLVWAAHLLSITNYQSPITNHRLSGIDLMKALCKLAAQKKWRVFLLGGKNDAAKNTALKLKAQNSKLSPIINQSLITNHFSGSKNIKNETADERNKTIKKINNFKPHLLFAAYGAPMQEKWIAKNLPQLNVKVAMGVGGAFDYIAGYVKRAPKWVRKAGLEWLWRLLHEPWRWRRQLRLIKFIFLVFKEKFT